MCVKYTVQRSLVLHGSTICAAARGDVAPLNFLAVALEKIIVPKLNFLIIHLGTPKVPWLGCHLTVGPCAHSDGADLPLEPLLQAALHLKVDREI